MSDLSAIAEYDAVDTFLDSVRTLVDESRIHFEKNGLRVQAVDPANAASVKAMLGSTAFTSYEQEARSVIGCNLDRLDEAISFASGDDLVGFTMQADGETLTEDGVKELAGKLEIDTGPVSHELALINPDSIRSEPDLPDLDLPAEVVLEGRQLSQAIKAADTVSEHVALTVDEEGTFRAVAKGDTDSATVEYFSDELIDVTPADVRSLYSLEYLKDLQSPIPKDAEVKIQLGNEFPALIRWQFAEGFGTVLYLLAPRIED